ncbi:MAG: hypothetical protein DYH14_04775 [Betaproteobacteria bacterium PRO3]|nr:hypothetical protein [Betaproteobacteria bacterium PRO3]
MKSLSGIVSRSSFDAGFWTDSAVCWRRFAAISSAALRANSLSGIVSRSSLDAGVGLTLVVAGFAASSFGLLLSVMPSSRVRIRLP